MGDGAGRDRLRALAAGTVAALEGGGYVGASGTAVALDGDIARQVAGTTLLAAEEPAPRVAPRRGLMAVRVTGEDAVTALIDGAGPACCLVFASARNPGGGFLNGANAQEESIVRSSTLWASLRAAPDFYERHRASRDLAYSDALIHAPHAHVIRDAGGALLDAPVPCAFIVAAAPNAAAMAGPQAGDLPSVPGIVARRVARVLAVAAANGHARLVLGAWGCGVFGNEPGMVARTFRDGLAAAPFFDEVTFAVPGESSAHHRAFAETFGPPS